MTAPGPPERTAESAAGPRRDVVAELGFTDEVAALRAAIGSWRETSSEEVRDALDWQLAGGSKYFRPLTVFSCHHAAAALPIPESTLRRAVALELIHNVSLVVDDILDRSDERRGRATLQRRFGDLKSLMTSGYMTAEGFRLLREDPGAIDLVAELMSRLAAAECLQWRLRRQPLGVEDWRRIAGEDTGSMFEVAACLGDRSGSLRRFGHLLGVLYHGCDDVGDVRGAAALGGGGGEDLRDGILTLPAALAIRESAVQRMFCDPRGGHDEALAEAFAAALPEAERHLDLIARDACEEATLFAADPRPLLRLVEETRNLSSR